MPERLRRIAAEQKAVSDWLPLDNAALIFPASENADMSSMFRVGALLNEPIDPVELQYAVNEVVPRFPGFAATLKGGFFRYYLEPSATPLVVQEGERISHATHSARHPPSHGARPVLRKRGRRGIFPRGDRTATAASSF